MARFLNSVRERLQSFLQVDRLAKREQKLANRIAHLEKQLNDISKRADQGVQAWEMRDRVQRVERFSRFAGRRIGQMTHMPPSAMGRQGLFPYENQVFSQNGEDGIILHILDRIGVSNRKFVEIGAGGLENNTNNLFFNYGWTGLWCDADKGRMEELKNYISLFYPERLSEIRIFDDYVVPENVEGLIVKNDIGMEPDFLSLDIDSFEYHVLGALRPLRARLMVIEYNSSFGLESVTIPFDPEFDRRRYDRLYHGASLTALSKRATEMGYVLVGCDSEGINAFFVREDCAGDLPRLTPEEAFVPNRRRTRRYTQEEQWRRVSAYPLEKVV